MNRRNVAIPMASVVLLAVLTVAGCSRAFWRNQGDADTYAAVGEKMNDQRWSVPRYGIEPDPRSRFYDPYDPDAEPLPPDDPAAHEFMHWIDGRRGYKNWHSVGDAETTENPDWVTMLKTYDLDGVVVPPIGDLQLPHIEQLSLKDVLELSYIHSRDYQREIEDVYLSALALTLQRFTFDVHYLEAGSSLTGTSVPGGDNTLGLDGRSGPLGLSQLLPTGGQWIVQMANNTLWLFSGPNQTSSSSTLSYSIVQPLLIGAGRKIFMESLTQSERSLLYTVRELARFRKQFFTDTVAGGASTGYLGLLQQRQIIRNQQLNLYLLNNQLEMQSALSSSQPSRIEADLTTVSDELLQTFENIPNVLRDASMADLLTLEVGVKKLSWRGPMSEDQAEAIRKLSQDSLYQRAVQVLIEISFRTIEVPLDQLPEGIEFAESIRDRLVYDAEKKVLSWRGPMYEGDVLLLEDLEFVQNNLQEAVERLRVLGMRRVQDLRLAQLETQRATRINQLRDSERTYADLMDRFKLQLGLPPDMVITIDETLLEPFEMIDTTMIDLEARIRRYVIDELRNPKLRINPELSDILKLTESIQQLETELRTTGMSLLTRDLKRVQSIVTANDQGTAKADGLRVFRLVEDGEQIERNRVLTALTQDEQQVSKLQGELNLISGQINLVRNFAERDSIDDVMQFLDKNKNQKVEIDELPNAWDELVKVRADVDDDGVISAEEFLKATVFNIQRIHETMKKIAQNILVLQIGLRVERIDFNDFTLPGDPDWPMLDQCLSTGLENRLDLMNQKASVMDARRKMEVAANDLEAVLDVVVDGRIGSPSNDTPLDFRGDLGSFSAGLRFTAPLEQVRERNAYNTSLVSYQRSRRDYINYEDQVKQQIRQRYRQLDVLRQNIDIDRQSIRLAATQYDNSVELATRSQQNALNLLNALSSVLNAQNSLIRDWVNYERNRLNIYRDMGIMEVDPRGIWYDSFYQDEDSPADEDSSSRAPAANDTPNTTSLTHSIKSLTAENGRRRTSPHVMSRGKTRSTIQQTSAALQPATAQTDRGNHDNGQQSSTAQYLSAAVSLGELDGLRKHKKTRNQQLDKTRNQQHGDGRRSGGDRGLWTPVALRSGAIGAVGHERSE
ncbi:MAG: TolC family protein [Planctomycetaceae bacterium]